LGFAGLFGEEAIIHGLSASTTAAAITTIGLIAVAAFGSLVRRYSAYFSAFAVGLLTVAVMFHLILEALDVSMVALGWIGTGFMAMAVIAIGVHATVYRRVDGPALTFGYASIIALAAHSFLDGVVYAVVFQDEPFTGWLTTGGLLVHEFPEGVIAYYLLAHAGLARVPAIMFGFIAAGVTTVAGTIFANVLFALTMTPPLAAMYGAAAGALIFVLIVHLGPQAAKAPRGRGYFAAQIGVAVGTAAVIFNCIVGIH